MKSAIRFTSCQPKQVSSPRGLGHIVAGILSILDWTDVDSI